MTTVAAYNFEHMSGIQEIGEASATIIGGEATTKSSTSCVMTALPIN